MKILVAGFEPSARERMSRALQQEGHHVLCVGVELATAMAPGFGPDAIYVPDTEQGLEARSRLESILGDVPISSVAANESAEPLPDAMEPELAPAIEPELGPVSDRAQGASTSSAPAEPLADMRGSLTTPDIRSKLEQVRFGHYHAILEVTPSTSPFVVKEHFDALSRLYNPAGWPHRLTPDEVHHLAEIGEALREAFAILGHSELRARYERALSRQRR